MRLPRILLIALVLSLVGSRALSADYANLAGVGSAYSRGDYQGALKLSAALLRKEPRNLSAHYLLGNCYAKLGQREKAIAEYKYCVQAGRESNAGKYSALALKQVNSQAGDNDGTTATPPAQQADKTDLAILEYKERLLKEGTEKIAVNKSKLQRQIEAAHHQADDEIQNIQSQIAASPNRIAALAAFGPAQEAVRKREADKISLLEQENQIEEQKITSYYQSLIDKFSSQKSNLASQAERGKSDMRLMQQGSGLFVRNYVNFHGEVPLPPPPPELKATAGKLSPAPAKGVKSPHG